MRAAVTICAAITALLISVEGVEGKTIHLPGDYATIQAGSQLRRMGTPS